MNEQEQFEEWFANDTKGLDKASARAGWVERMAREGQCNTEAERYTVANTGLPEFSETGEFVAYEQFGLVTGRKDAEIARLREECESYKAQLEAARNLQPQLEKVFGFARFVIKCFHKNGEYAPLSSQEPHEVAACLDILENVTHVPARVVMPERKRTDHLSKEYKTMTVVRAGLEAYNRALDEVARLNGLEGGAK